MRCQQRVCTQTTTMTEIADTRRNLWPRSLRKFCSNRSWQKKRATLVDPSSIKLAYKKPSGLPMIAADVFVVWIVACNESFGLDNSHFASIVQYVWMHFHYRHYQHHWDDHPSLPWQCWGEHHWCAKTHDCCFCRCSYNGAPGSRCKANCRLLRWWRW